MKVAQQLANKDLVTKSNIYNEDQIAVKKQQQNMLNDDYDYTEAYTVEVEKTKIKDQCIEDLNDIKLGFRSKYIYELVNNITLSDIDKIDEMTTSDAINYLTSFKGIGLKIASCILLFGYKRLDVFPIDTWVKKYMNDTYGISDMKKTSLV